MLRRGMEIATKESMNGDVSHKIPPIPAKLPES